MNNIILYYFPKAGEIPKEGDEVLVENLEGDQRWKARHESLMKTPYETHEENFVRRPMIQIPSQSPLHVLCGSEFCKETTTVSLTKEDAQRITKALCTDHQIPHRLLMPDTVTEYCDWENGMGGYRACPENHDWLLPQLEVKAGTQCPVCKRIIRIYVLGEKGEKVYL